MRIKDIAEKWRPVDEYEGLYEVSTLGRVKSMRGKTRIADKDGGILRQKTDTGGYYRVNLYKNNHCKSALVSRLVATAFIPNPNGLPHVGHQDDNPKNNAVTNLYWTEPCENNRHNGKLERLHIAHKDKIKQIAKKLSIKVVGTSVVNGSRITFDSMQETLQHGFEPSKVSMCVNGKRLTHKGYKWERM